MVFVLGLVAGLIIGWIIEWIIDWQFWRAGEDFEGDISTDLQEKLEQAQLELVDLRDQLSRMPAPPRTPDDLSKIKGIGPVYEKRLASAGIRTYADLAAAEPSAIGDAIGVENWKSVDVAHWIDAAQTFVDTAEKGS